MKHLFTFLLLTISLSGFSQNQSEMNITAYESLQKVDDELNKVYQDILKEYKHDTLFIKNLRTAQKLWIQF